MYKVYVHGIYVGIQELTPADIKKINNDSTITIVLIKDK